MKIIKTFHHISGKHYTLSQNKKHYINVMYHLINILKLKMSIANIEEYEHLNLEYLHAKNMLQLMFSNNAIFCKWVVLQNLWILSL